MKIRKSLLIPLSILVLAVLACSLPVGATPTADPKLLEEQVATAAAATLTAMASPPAADLPAATESNTAIPTETVTPTPTPLITEMPAIAPEELRVAFSDRQGNLWAWADGGVPIRLIDSGDVEQVRISPDGEWIAFTRTSADFLETSLWAVRFDGSSEKLLVSHAEFMEMPLHPALDGDADFLTIYPWMMEFVPNSHTLAFNTAPQFEGPGFFDNKDLWLVNLENGSRSSLLAAGQAGHFTYSPDGTQIALVTPTDISLINADGSNRHSSVLVYEMVYTYSEYAYHATPKWAPDGSYLRVIIPPQDPLGSPEAPGHIYQIPANGSPASLLGSLPLAMLENGSFSPDLNRIAYLQQVGDPADNTFSLQIANGDGSGSSEFTRGSLDFVSWAQNSNHFAYMVWSPRAITLAAVDSGSTTLLDANPAGELRWLPDNRFLFFYQVEPEWQLRIGNLGAASTVIAVLGEGERFPSYDFVSP